MPEPIRSVDGDRLRADIEATAEFGAVDIDHGRGRTVLTGTDANRQARKRLVEQLEATGATVRVDAVGNIAGRWVPRDADADAAPVAIGSHLDSVPEGGIFDGVLGVYAGVETVRALREADVSSNRPIDVVAFTEEEGARFGDGVLGSSVAAGKTTVEEALARTDANGVTLEAALEDIGYRGEGRLDACAWDAFFELHVEQAPRLEAEGVPVGVVTTIAGVTHGTIEIQGSANHAGSTPMTERTDALAAASELVLALEETTARRADGEGSLVGTVGKLDISPGAVNVIPGEASLRFDVRDVSQPSIDRIVDRMNEELECVATDRGVTTTLRRDFTRQPTAMSPRLREPIHAAAERLDIDSMELHSGAFHDTMNIADVTDTALLFAPSRDGISHSPLEWTDWADCKAATTVLTAAVRATANTGD